jgi:CarboxypepD_reg-like domain
MNHWKKLVCAISSLLVITFSGYAQKMTRGIVMDSVSLKTLAGVHVRVKNSDRGAVTNASGVFNLATNPTDTLVLSFVGYNSLELPLLFEEEDILIRLSERIRMLKEITIRGTRLYESEIVRTPRTQPRKMTASDGFSSPWEYFSKGQREKRKVVKLINENDRIKTYIQVINSQEIREDIIDAHGLTEVEYYNTLAKFNQQSQDVLYSTDEDLITYSLKSFFKNTYR